MFVMMSHAHNVVRPRRKPRRGLVDALVAGFLVRSARGIRQRRMAAVRLRAARRLPSGRIRLISLFGSIMASEAFGTWFALHAYSGQALGISTWFVNLIGGYLG
jgi:hypothetical protein